MGRYSGTRRWLLEWLMVAGFVVAAIVLVSVSGALFRLDAAFYDVSLRLRERPPAADLAIVAIDDASLERIGRWPWTRKLHAALLDRLTAAGVAAVASDLILTEDEAASPEADRMLAAAMKANGKVILPVLHEMERNRGVTEVMPIAALAEAAAGFGHIRRTTDADGLVRRAALWTGSPEVLRPHLALAMLGLTDPERYRSIVASDEPRLIPYAGPPGHYKHYSYSDVLLGKVPEGELRGKVVFVGASATGLSDNFPSPLSKEHVDMAGIEICATLYDALRSGIEIREVPGPIVGFISTISVLLLLVALRVSSPHAGFALTAGHAITWLLGPLVLLVAGGVWLPPAAALAGTVLAFPLWSWRRLAAAQAYMEHEIAELGREHGVLPSGYPKGTRVADPFARSIEDVRSAVQRLRTARRFVQNVIDALPVGIIVADGQAIVRLSNTYLKDFLGSADDLQGAFVPRVLEGLKWPTGVDSKIVSTQPGLARPLEVETSSGRHALLAINNFEEGGILLTLADITSLHQAQAARDMALGFLSHDLRAPLASILTLLEESTFEDKINRIASHANAALAMADDFTQLARAESLDTRTFAEIDLVVVIEDAIDDAWLRARDKPINIVRDIAASEAVIRGDRAVLRRAVFNLLDNAIRYSPVDSSVFVRLSYAGMEWRLDIADQGYGIAADDLARLFIPYVRLNPPGQPRTQGTGLGLPMVKAASERHGGRVEVASVLGTGTTFTVFLPALLKTGC